MPDNSIITMIKIGNKTFNKIQRKKDDLYFFDNLHKIWYSVDVRNIVQKVLTKIHFIYRMIAMKICLAYFHQYMRTI